MDGGQISPDAWNNPTESALMLRRATIDDEGVVVAATLLLNPSEEDRVFALPPPALPTRMLLDTALPDAPEQEIERAEVMVSARSAILLVSEANEVTR